MGSSRQLRLRVMGALGSFDALCTSITPLKGILRYLSKWSAVSLSNASIERMRLSSALLGRTEIFIGHPALTLNQ